MNTQRMVFDYTNCLSGSIGSRHGLSKADLDGLARGSARCHASLQRQRKAGELGFYDLPYAGETVKQVKRLARSVKGKYENLVVLGIGGSALGNIALATALLHPYHNLLERSGRHGRPRVFVIDNIDPHQLSAFFKTIHPGRTLFTVITKSGATAETMAQFLMVRRLLLRHVGKRFAEHLVAITDASRGALRRVVQGDALRSLEIPGNVGGRFSVLSPVGLFFAAVSGMPVDGLLRGARNMERRCRSGVLFKNPAYLFSAIQYLMDVKKGKHISVMMPYSHRLKDVADWYRQLWAESLGKRHDRRGRIVEAGPTPVKALGVTDQHSQVQLYAEGPNDKIFTFLAVRDHGVTLRIPKSHMALDALDYLGGKTVNELFEAERVGTEIALTHAQRPNCTMVLPKVNAEYLGGLFFWLELATAFSGELYGINAFDQPGVEAGKIAAYAQLGRTGYEKTARDILKKQKNRRRVVMLCS